MNKINKGQLVKSNLSKEEMSKAFSLALTNKNLITEDDYSSYIL